MKIENKRITVTGGAGFIGSNLSEELSTGNAVMIPDNFFSGRQENIAELMNYELCRL